MHARHPWNTSARFRFRHRGRSGGDQNLVQAQCGIDLGVDPGIDPDSTKHQYGVDIGDQSISNPRAIQADLEVDLGADPDSIRA